MEEKAAVKKVVIFGATGSIGTQTVDVVKQLGGFEVVGISFGSNIEIASRIMRDLGVEYYFSKKDIGFGKRCQSVDELLEKTSPDIVVCAIPGFEGVKTTFSALRYAKRIALATKEALVCAGPFVKDLARENNVELIPVDSEHSAIFQLYEPHIEKILITASGGAVRDVPLERISELKPSDILKHPTWSMGGRITVDSATMVNKLFEVIEAHELFNLEYGRIDVKINRLSFIHGIVFLKDGVIKIHAGKPDMRIPIAYALTYPERKYHSYVADVEEFDLTLFDVERERYPLFFYGLELTKDNDDLAWRIALNAADEVAVNAFLNREIMFTDIEKVVRMTIEYILKQNISVQSIEDVYEIDNLARSYALNYVEKEVKK
ncbi:1-deoxy-D-xylulose 5-phosphate reductoisomerase [Fervidobacterium changbaicum]|uniref:1-deoxy-D-xylulose 5-phosphate reductoisomerase n=1 Tax=Fervidobacterium changbaicum TaxID=310769 RepID=A0ABX5QR82_9BACT|nr:1-deoxy-D-xylulose-5-phosphate reductoisomerase [Fervidobacterium changbaicum]QAV32980.1 1-deoxy-D-xylulose-5-phosphate reductoisomerase [Fervidobacterium changbaicum]SDH61143.1 1-deoxy-D-xylulose 5-phosphate reductoisomerase [Fervidobacterium changbaicum]